MAGVFAGVLAGVLSRLFAVPVCPETGRIFDAGTFTVCEAVADSRVSPARTEQTGHAPGPWLRSTFSATAICWFFVARSAREA